MEFDERHVEGFINNRRRKSRLQRGDGETLRQFLVHLRGCNITPGPEPIHDDSPLAKILNRYEKHLRSERGVAPATVVNYLPFARKFLVERFPEGTLLFREVRSSDISAFKDLTADEAEQFIFITGAEVDGVRVLDQAIPLEHAKRTAMGVTADTRFTHRILIKLEQFGHKLLGHFHSHPGRGANSTLPSGTDEKFQQRLESAGHAAVTAIFSRDGYVRFFRLDNNIEIEIYGEGAEKHEANVYRLTNLDQA